MNLLALIRNSPPCRNEANGLLRDLVDLLQHFVQFPINDNTGSQLSRDEIFDHHRGRLAILQRTALKYFKSQLTILALSNYGAIDQRSQLEENLGALTDIELLELASRLGFRTSYPQSIRVPVSRQLLLELLILNHERPKNFQESIKALHSLPTEVDLYNPSLLRNEAYDGSRSLAIPKLNLQYLTVGDFLWRSYVLFRSESFFEIRNDMEETVQRLKPGIHASGDLRLDGFSRMALKIPKPG